MMKHILILLICLAAISAPVSASFYDVRADSLFGIVVDSSKYNAVDTFAVQQLAKLKTATWGPEFSEVPYICKKYSFADLHCLKLYHVNCAMVPHGGPYAAFLFNTCDSAICPFDGDSNRFWAVMKSYVGGIMAQKHIMNLLRLYIDMLSFEDPYRIINSVNDYVAIWDNAIPRVFFYSDVRDDIEVMRKLGPKTESVFTDGYTTVRLWTWNEMTGAVERWHFEISETYFKVLERVTKASKMGPYMALFHR